MTFIDQSYIFIVEIFDHRKRVGKIAPKKEGNLDPKITLQNCQ